MGQRTTGERGALRGFGIPDERLSAANLSTTLSSYTQRERGPGTQVPRDPLSRLEPVVSGGQEQDLEVRVQRPGNPGVVWARSCSVLYRRTGDPDTSWRGWSTPSALVGWRALTWSDAQSWSQFDCVTLPQSQKVVMVHGEDGVVASPYARTLDPTTWSWGAPYAVTAASWTYYDVALAVLPNGRVLSFLLRSAGGVDEWVAVYSDDAGVTWSSYATHQFEAAGALPGRMGSAVTNSRTRAASVGGVGMVLVREGISGTAGMLQWASDSLGTTWSQVGAGWTAGPPTMCNLVALKSGRVALVFRANSGPNSIGCRVVGSPWEEFQAAPETAIVLSMTPIGLAAWVDDDGVLYCVAVDVSGESYTRISYDEGATWVDDDAGIGLAGGPFDSHSWSTHPTRIRATSSLGRAVLLHNWNAAPGNEGGSIGCMYLGGWSNMEFAPSHGVVGNTGSTWLPMDLPEDTTYWTATGLGSSLLSGGEIAVTNHRNWNRLYGTGSQDIEMEATLRFISGGLLTSNRIGVWARIDTGAARWEIEVNVASTGFRLRNAITSGTLGSDASFDTTQDFDLLVRWDGTSKVVRTYWKRPSEHIWTAGPTGTPSSSGTAGQTQVIWGHRQSSTISSAWKRMRDHVRTSAGAVLSRTGTAELIGRPLAVRPSTAPAIGAATAAGALSLRGGPGYLGELFDVPAPAAYGVAQALWGTSPSPAQQWETTDESEQVLAWDLGQATSLGTDSLFLAALNVNWRTAYLEGSTGGAWTTLATLDLASGRTNIDFARYGEVVVPDYLSGTDGTRYDWSQELVDGTIHFTGPNLRRRITRQEAGGWATGPANAAMQTRLWMSGVSGTEGSFGKCDLWAPSGVAVVHGVNTRYSRWRIRIPAQTTVDGRLRTGALVAGAVFPFGQQHARGWAIEAEPNVETITDGWGTTRVRRRGPAVRTLSLGWQDPVQQVGLRRSIRPNWMAADVGDPLVARHDVPQWLLGLLRLLRGGEVPVLALPAIPATSPATITDPSLFLWGRLEGRVRLDHRAGREGIDEALNIGTLNVRELV